ncbi:MAG TPA: S9 family peptidase [Pyrinomonadaceae bacterium]|jgi:dipeptidyl aminopeptidase/acylaminoacyl peptidase|nr:S9 family peptidase [Pyrinomonadaceae bacterium]
MRFRVSLLLIVVVFLAAPALAQKRSITEKDLFNFVWIGDPQVSPDGSRVAFVRVTVNEKKDGYNTAIWTVSTSNGETRQLTNGPRDSTPRWSPDGNYLLFARAPEISGRVEPAQLFMLAMSGGEPFQFTTLPRGAGGPQWSPDGKMILFYSGATAEELAKAAAKNAPSPTPAASPAASPTPPERESDVRVINRAVYRANGTGYLDFKHPQHVWVVTAPKTGDEKVTPKQLTKGHFDDSGAVWAKDSSRIYFETEYTDEPYYELPRTDIYTMAVNGGESTKLTSFDMGAGAFTVSPDGKQLAFIASVSQPVRSYSQPDLWVMDLAANAKPHNLTANFDFDIGGGLTGDNAAPRGGGGNLPVWSADGRSITMLYVKEGRANLGSFEVATGKLSEVTTGNQGVVSYRAVPDASKFVLLISTPTRVGDLYWFDKSSGQPKQLTHINDEMFSKLNLTEPEEVWYTSFDGKKIQTWVQKPPDFDPNKKYPLILNIHGGPHAAYGFIFDHEFQWMAAKGYVVLYPNPRGSTSYGQEFGNIIQHNYPGDDYKDLMAGVDELIRRGYIDDKKMGVTGGSGGGLLTNWTVGQTTRFAAAVSQRDIASWTDWWYTADFTLFQPSWFKAPPFEDPEDYKRRSPITYVNKIQTPLMLILGEVDWRTPTGPGGEAMFRALKYRKIPTVMVRFPNESHELSRSGQPWHRIERLQHIVGWFDKWIMGVPKPEYDIGEVTRSTTTQQ